MRKFVLLDCEFSQAGIALANTFYAPGWLQLLNHDDIDCFAMLKKPDVAKILGEILPGSAVLKSKEAFLYATLSAKPHRDLSNGAYTFGAVLHGDHWGFTGNYHRCVRLRPGTCFLLHNQTKHGAVMADDNSSEPLVFLTIDFHATSMEHAIDLLGMGIRKERPSQVRRQDMQIYSTV